MTSIHSYELNRVFLAVRNYYYHQQRSITEVCDFEQLAQAAQVGIDELGNHLERLLQLDLIRYSMNEDKYVFLTSYGGKITNLDNIN